MSDATKPPFLPVCEPLMLGKELEYVTEAVRSNWISSSGAYIKDFEQRFAEYLGVKHAVTVVNGTAALHLACAALDLKAGDEVIIPDFTMVASAFAVCYTGAKPVFVDAEPATWNLDVWQLEAKITPRTRAIMPVHIYGHPCDMDPILEVARRHKLAIIEDAAEVHGALYKQKKVGGLGDIGCFSLFANKIITTGEGGMVVTNDDALHRRCIYLKNLSFPLEGPRNYVHEDIGFNYRMTNVTAAIGLAQLERIDDYVDRRRENARYYRELLAGIPGIGLQPDLAWAKNVYWMIGMTVGKESGSTRDAMMAGLKDRGIDTRKFFYPMHRQPALIKFGCAVDGAYPVSDRLSDEGLYLPSGSGLTRAEIERVADAVRSVLKARSRS